MVLKHPYFAAYVADLLNSGRTVSEAFAAASQALEHDVSYLLTDEEFEALLP